MDNLVIALMGILILLFIIILIFTILNYNKLNYKNKSNLLKEVKIKEIAESLKDNMIGEIRNTRTEINANLQSSISLMTETLSLMQTQDAQRQDKKIDILIHTLQTNQETFKLSLEENIKTFKSSISENISNLEKSNTEILVLLSKAQIKQFELQDNKITEMSKGLIDLLSEKQSALKHVVNDRLTQVDDRFQMFTKQNKESLDDVRNTIEKRLSYIQEDNGKQLDKMRETVDEKLQKTLDERITQSFKLVNDRLQEVYTGLGEMKTLANGVGDLKKVLSNVKTRGVMGELQLAAILEEILSKEQYEENVITKKGSTYRVEFAIKLPGDNNNFVYLPIDAKFPADAYHTLVDAYEIGDVTLIDQAYLALETRIKGCAKDIHDKYIDPPNTTDFAIMFLPFEGLYAEVIRHGLVDILQKKYKVNIAGPTTFSALLNSLQMGFRTLAIQKRSGEVWDILGAVKTEFNTFSNVLETAQKRIEQTGAELDKLIGVRTRKINSKLREVVELPIDKNYRLSEVADGLDVSE